MGDLVQGVLERHAMTRGRDLVFVPRDATAEARYSYHEQCDLSERKCQA